MRNNNYNSVVKKSIHFLQGRYTSEEAEQLGHYFASQAIQLKLNANKTELAAA